MTKSDARLQKTSAQASNNLKWTLAPYQEARHSINETVAVRKERLQDPRRGEHDGRVTYRIRLRDTRFLGEKVLLEKDHAKCMIAN
jgi:hypothetical protein